MGLLSQEETRAFAGTLTPTEEQAALASGDPIAWKRRYATTMFLASRLNESPDKIRAGYEQYRNLYFGPDTQDDAAYTAARAIRGLPDALPKDEPTTGFVARLDKALAETMNPDQAAGQYVDLMGTDKPGRFAEAHKAVARKTSTDVAGAVSGPAAMLGLTETARRIQEFDRTVQQALAVDPQVAAKLDASAGQWGQVLDPDWWAVRGGEMIPDVVLFAGGYTLGWERARMVMSRVLPQRYTTWAAGKLGDLTGRVVLAAAPEAAIEAGSVVGEIDAQGQAAAEAEEQALAYIETLPAGQQRDAALRSLIPALAQYRTLAARAGNNDLAATAARQTFTENMVVNAITDALAFGGTKAAAMRWAKGSRGMVATAVGAAAGGAALEVEQELAQEDISDMAVAEALARKVVQARLLRPRLVQTLTGDDPQRREIAITTILQSVMGGGAVRFAVDLAEARSMAQYEAGMARVEAHVRQAAETDDTGHMAALSQDLTTAKTVEEKAQVLNRHAAAELERNLAAAEVEAVAREEAEAGEPELVPALEAAKQEVAAEVAAEKAAVDEDAPILTPEERLAALNSPPAPSAVAVAPPARRKVRRRFPEMDPLEAARGDVPRVRVGAEEMQELRDQNLIGPEAGQEGKKLEARITTDPNATSWDEAAGLLAIHHPGLGISGTDDVGTVLTKLYGTNGERQFLDRLAIREPKLLRAKELDVGERFQDGSGTVFTVIDKHEDGGLTAASPEGPVEVYGPTQVVTDYSNLDPGTTTAAELAQAHDWALNKAGDRKVFFRPRDFRTMARKRLDQIRDAQEEILPEERFSAAQREPADPALPARPELQAQLDAEVARFPALAGVRVQLSEDLLRTKKGDAAWGLWRDGVIHVSMQSPNPLRIAREEIFHGLFERGILTEQELKILQQKDQEWRDKYQIDALYPEVSDAKKAEEAYAHAFAALPETERTVLDKLWSFFRAVGNWLRNLGFRTAEDVMVALDQGTNAVVEGQTELSPAAEAASAAPPTLTGEEIKPAGETVTWKDVYTWARKTPGYYGRYTVEATGWEVVLNRDGLAETLKKKAPQFKFRSIPALPELIRLGTNPRDEIDSKGHPGIEAFEYLDAEITIAGEVYSVRLTLARDPDGGRKFYFHYMETARKHETRSVKPASPARGQIGVTPGLDTGNIAFPSQNVKGAESASRVPAREMSEEHKAALQQDLSVVLAGMLARKEKVTEAGVRAMSKQYGLDAKPRDIIQEAMKLQAELILEAHGITNDNELMSRLIDAKGALKLQRIQGEMYKAAFEKGGYVQAATTRLAAERERNKARALAARAGLDKTELAAAGVDGSTLVSGDAPADIAATAATIRQTVLDKLIAEGHFTSRKTKPEMDPVWRAEYARTWANLLSATAAGKLPARIAAQVAVSIERNLRQRSPSVARIEMEAQRIVGMIHAGRVRLSKAELLEKIDRELSLKALRGPVSTRQELAAREIHPAARRWVRVVKSVYDLGTAAVAERCDMLAEVQGDPGHENRTDRAKAEAWRRELEAWVPEFKSEPWYREQDTEMLMKLATMAYFQYGALKHKTEGEMATALEDLQAQIDGGIEAVEKNEADLRAKVAGDVKTMLDSQHPANPVTDPGDLWRTIKRELMSPLDFWHRLRMLGEYATDATHANLKTLAERLGQRNQTCLDRKVTAIREQTAAIDKTLESIYKMPAWKAKRELRKARPELARFSRNEVMPRFLSRQEALQIVAYCEQRIYHQPALSHGRDAAYVAELRQALPAEDLVLLDALRAFYTQARGPISDVAETLTGVRLYDDDPLYMPMQVWRPAQGPETVVRDSVILPGGLTRRVQHGYDVDETAGVLDMLDRRVSEFSHFVAFGEFSRDLRATFGSEDVNAAIEKLHGKGVLDAFRGQWTDIIKGGYNAGYRMAALDRLATATAFNYLSWRVASGMRQVTGVVQFGHKIGLADVAKHLTTAGSEEGRAAMKVLVSSDQWKNRYWQGPNDLLANALAAPALGKTMHLLQKGMMIPAAGDMVATALVGQGIYRDAYATGIRMGMTPEQAQQASLTRVFHIVSLTQQGTDPSVRPEWSRRGGQFGRYCGMFLQNQAQMYAFEYVAMQEALKAKRPGSMRALMNTLAINHFLAPAAIGGVNLLMKALLGDDRDDEWWKLVLPTIIGGPIGGMVVFGGLTESLIAGVIRGKPQFDSIVPGDWTVKGAVSAWRMTTHLTCDFDLDEAVQDADRWGRAWSGVYKDASKLYQNRIAE